MRKVIQGRIKYVHFMFWQNRYNASKMKMDKEYGKTTMMDNKWKSKIALNINKTSVKRWQGIKDIF